MTGIRNEPVIGHVAVKLGPAPSQTIEEKLVQERNMGFNEGWLAAIAHLTRIHNETLIKIDELKDYRR